MQTHAPAEVLVKRTMSVVIFAFGVALLLALGSSCSTLPVANYEPPEIPGAHFVGNQACYYCHTNYVRIFPASAHGRIHIAAAAMSGGTGCESCHGAGSKHIESGGGRGKFIINPGKAPSACFKCHLETQTEFLLPQHHPVIEGRMNCVQCHDPHGGDIFKPAGGLAMARLNGNCAQCHREQTRPVAFEHGAMREGCVTCHNPHGSINRKMLTQNDPNLCLRCHAQNPGIFAGSGTILIGSVDHSVFLSRATCWASGCHTAVHGSNVDPRLTY